MAANTETVRIDTVEKSLWDSLKTLGENISGEALAALLEMVERGGAKPFEVVTTTEFGEEAVTQTTEVKAAALYAAINSGRPIKLAESKDSAFAIVPMIAEVEGTGDSAKYNFGYVNNAGMVFAVDELSGTDDVVLTASLTV